MSAGVEPETGSVDRETLLLPDWLPQPVGDVVQLRWVDLIRNRAEPENVHLLRRLASDSRMRKVWNELQKRKREDYQPTVKFFHPATPTTTWFADVRYALEHPERAEQGGGPPAQYLAAYRAAVLSEQYRGAGPKLSQQDLAIAYFFDEAFTHGQKNVRLIGLSELRKNRSHYRGMAKRLRADAAEQERLGLYDARRMQEAAVAYEELADIPAPAPGFSLLVKRQPRTDARLKSFVITMTDITRSVFGSPLYGSVATIANVVFSRDDLTFATVRKMLSSHPARNST